MGENASNFFLGQKQHEKILLLIIFSTVIVICIDLIGEIFSLRWAQHVFFDILKIFAPVWLLIFHSTYTLTLRRGLGLIVLFFLTGLFSEVVGIKHGILFGEYYSYNTSGLVVFSELPLFVPKMFLWEVPVLVPVYWAVFVYAGYSLSTSFLFWQNKRKPSCRAGDMKVLFELILLDALTVLAIDLIIDPILVHLGGWRWERSGLYFGIPIKNFLGWFCVVFLSSGIFRTFEYFFPKETEGKNPFFFLFPGAGFLIFFIASAYAALQQGLYGLIIVGLSTVFPVLAVNFYSFYTGENGWCKLVSQFQKYELAKGA